MKVQYNFPISSNELMFDFLFLQSMMTRQLPVHPVVPEHELSRSYQPSTTGIAAYYQVFLK